MAAAPINILCLQEGLTLEPARGASVPIGAITPARAGSTPRTRWWVELLTVGWLCWLYDAVTELTPLRLNPALAHGRGVLALERALHIDPEASLDHWLAARHTLGVLLSDYYDNAHFVVTLGLLGWLWWQRADIYRPLRNTLVLVNVIAFVVFWRFPVAPPRMLPGFTDVVASSGAFGSWHSGALASHANQLAAMPSLHIAWALWCTLALWRLSSRRVVRTLAVLYPCLTSVAVLATGNHYVLDILAGALTLALAAALVGVGGALRGRAAPPIEPHAALSREFARLRGACHKVVTKSPSG